MSVLEDTVGLWVAGGFAATMLVALRGLTHTAWAQHHLAQTRSSDTPERVSGRAVPTSAAR